MTEPSPLGIEAAEPALHREGLDLTAALDERADETHKDDLNGVRVWQMGYQNNILTASVEGVQIDRAVINGQPWVSAKVEQERDSLARRLGVRYQELTEARQEIGRLQTLRPGITACITTHPARMTNGKLQRALASVLAQTRQPDAIIVGNDPNKRGAAWNRQQVLNQVQTQWMAWLDSDDEWLPEHLRLLEETAESTDSVFVFPWMEGHDPLGHFGLPFNPATPHHTTITFLVRTDLAKRVGFGEDFLTIEPGRRHGGEDWLHILGLCKIALEEDLQMTHLAERTWRFNFDGNNTSGVPGQGDAR